MTRTKQTVKQKTLRSRTEKRTPKVVMKMYKEQTRRIPGATYIFAENDRMSTPRFVISFRDIVENIRSYDGTSTIPVEVWIKEYEEQATRMYWNDFQKFLFVKKGMAKLFVLSERSLNSRKIALLSGFK